MGKTCKFSKNKKTKKYKNFDTKITSLGLVLRELLKKVTFSDSADIFDVNLHLIFYYTKLT
jgi:hypothetical protein